MTDTADMAVLQALPPISGEDTRIAVPPRQDRHEWLKSYQRRLLLTDALVLAGSTALAVFMRFGLSTTASTSGGLSLPYDVLAAIMTASWMLALTISGARDERVCGSGPLEYKRVMNATVWLFGTLSILSVATKIEVSRAYLAVAVPVGAAGLVLSRRLWRTWLRRQRRRGHCITNVLVLGDLQSASVIGAELVKNRAAGMRVTGVWTADRPAGAGSWLRSAGEVIPVWGSDLELEEVLSRSRAHTVVVADSSELGHEGLRELAWKLEAWRVDLMVSPNLLDVSRGRLHLTSVASMPFLHIDEPQYAEAATWPKVIFDRLLAALLVMAFSPLLLATALAVRLSSAGPVFYRQERIGRDGNPFWMTKFRSMRQNADAELHQLLLDSGQADKPLGKLEHDPRVTKVGQFIRRYSIDELPQLFNVLKGDMSLVGPRPQRQFEVELYDDVAYRRLRVRPGMTGLWQVSGRSGLDWEDAIRLDTYYVENWSLTADLMILWKTLRAVLASDGAY